MAEMAEMTEFDLQRGEKSLTERYHETSLTTPIEMVSFWMAVALPFLYLPLLMRGLLTTAETLAFVVLVALNVVALVGGHSYNQE